MSRLLWDLWGLWWWITGDSFGESVYEKEKKATDNFTRRSDA